MTVLWGQTSKQEKVTLAMIKHRFTKYKFDIVTIISCKKIFMKYEIALRHLNHFESFESDLTL